MIKRVQRVIGEQSGCLLRGAPRDVTLVTLAIMQHFRGPTRLLDWTHNSFVAAYFSCATHAPKDFSEDGVIYFFNLPALIHYADQSWSKYTRAVGDAEKASGFDITMFSDAPERWLCPLFIPDMAGAWQKLGIPDHVNPFIRMKAQESVFTVAGGNHMDHLALIDRVLPDQVDADQSSGKKWLAGPAKYKMIIAAPLKRQLVRWLEGREPPVSAATLFPGLDGTGMRESLALMAHEGE